MNRRDALKVLGNAVLFAAPFFSRIVQAFSAVAPARFVLIHDSSPGSGDRLLECAAASLDHHDPSWRQKLLVWDVRADGEKVRAFVARYGRGTSSFQWPIVVAVPESSEAHPEVELWTLDWLRVNFHDACYPISDGWWSVEGDWNPTLKKVRVHLLESPNHTDGKFERAWLEMLKIEEAQSLHSDHHREMIKQGKVYWKNVNAECSA